MELFIGNFNNAIPPRLRSQRKIYSDDKVLDGEFSFIIGKNLTFYSFLMSPICYCNI